MPIDVEALLRPITAAEPSGADLRYHTLTDQIKEARRRDDDLNQGVWKHDVKTADYSTVIRLGSEALTKHSKDLQIAAWMCEALLRREGFAGLRQGLELARKLLETFWDTIYPQMDEDGDLELRATPMQWIGSQLESGVRSAALTQAGHGWQQYRESKALPTEEEAGRDPAKAALRNDAIKAGSVTPEDFAKGLDATSLAFSEKVFHELGDLMQFVNELSSFCDGKFADEPPNFTPLKTALEEVQQTARILLIKKGGLQQKQAPTESAPQYYEVPVQTESPQSAQAAPATTAPATTPVPSPAAAASAPATVQVPQRSGGIQPTDALDAIERFLAAVRFIRREYPLSPAPYLMLRGLRWGELRATGGNPEPGLLEAPPGNVRVELKKLATEGKWEALREKAEDAVGKACGRGWLDAQRYAVTACQNTGADAAASAILSELKALLADIPQLIEWTLTDDTPCANQETMHWLEENYLLPGKGSAPAARPRPVQEWTPPPASETRTETSDGDAAGPDAFELAMDAGRAGRPEEALTILSREIAKEHSGRGRFLRKIQVAQVCAATGNEEIALPILQDLVEEIDRRSLEDWEGSEVVLQPLGLLYRSLAQSEFAEEERRRLYARICRLDPVRALSLGR
jgi:type VI secretion system protein ImpA